MKDKMVEMRANLQAEVAGLSTATAQLKAMVQQNVTHLTRKKAQIELLDGLLGEEAVPGPPQSDEPAEDEGEQ